MSQVGKSTDQESIGRLLQLCQLGKIQFLELLYWEYGFGCVQEYGQLAVHVWGN
jgi:hypothetical protein